jgi:hypothetical protein
MAFAPALRKRPRTLAGANSGVRLVFRGTQVAQRRDREASWLIRFNAGLIVVAQKLVVAEQEYPHR